MSKVALTNTYQRYPEYKDSEVEWLGEIPSEWSVQNIKSVIKKQYPGIWGDEELGDKNDIKCLRVADFDFNKLSYHQVKTIRNISQFERNRKIIPDQSILIEKSGGGEKTPVGRAIHYSEIEPMVCANFIDVVLPNNTCSSKYLSYYLFSLYSSGVNYKAIKQNTGIQNLDTKAYFKEVIPFPSKEEQEKIAKFLDEQTARIDETIAKKQRLIELLKEKRTATINHAVTKGLDPNAEQVDGGIDWIGKIPKGWKIKRFGFVADINASNIDKNVVEGQLVRRVCNYVDVYKNDYITNDLNFLTASATDEQIKKFSVKSEDIFLTKDSETADDIGVPAYVNETLSDVVVGYHIYQVRVKDQALLPEFTFRFLQSKFARVWFENKARGVTRFGLGSYGVKSLPLTVPPYEEQEKIAKYLKEHSEVSADAIAKINFSITKLQEFKSSLISHAVTGKIKI